jgi:nicotinamide-nucleotide amidase
MRISLVAVGNELLDGMVIDTNSTWIENELGKNGLKLQRKQVVRDDQSEIRGALEYYKNKSDLILLTGGLGPTEDDRTREALSDFFGKKLESSEEELEKIRSKFNSMNLPMPRQNEKQALVIPGSIVINNPKGTAPGIIYIKSTLAVAAFPGVPSELQAMFPDLIAFITANFHVNRHPDSVYMRTIGLPESAVDEKLSVLKSRGISVGTIARFGQVDFRFDHANGTPETVMDDLRRVLEQYPEISGRIFSFDRDESIEAAIVGKMKEAGRKIVLAESCTGGMIAKTITDVPGSSAVLLGSVVAYDNGVKERLLGVEPMTLYEHGAVSFETALAMAEGLRNFSNADYRISVTGIAGPDGGTADKPVGTVFIGFGKKDRTAAARFQFGGNRDNVRTRTMMKVFEMLWLNLTTGAVDFRELRGFQDLIIP